MVDYKPPYLTGNTRLRAKTRLFGKPLVVLQVEVKTDAHTRHFIDCCGYPDPRDFPAEIEWRDASIEDITFMNGGADLADKVVRRAGR